ncbi:DEAD/DEAH box helicase family protein [Bradyrhizobium sp. 172]|uniref:DEAD/DEAH box helicase family protein n=1 Tax=Bradyrhizobium sp. 172 TaxID=2782643 RepID=UPI001FFE514F|nr:DEAD/DEAH box helicase family protein [Bradyrhizobium sp. 172]UPJ96405.1 DEAD/DEAH box helicase family protein [Bradyrhizobium sp. 172]
MTLRNQIKTGRIVRYASAPCGAGKTFQLVKRAHQLVQEGSNVLLLQPTKLLIEKTRVEEFGLLSEPPSVKVFHGDTVGASVAHQLAEYLADPEDRPHVVMATHQALPRIPFLSNASNWHLLIDEVPQVDLEHAHIVPSTHPLLTGLIQVAQHDGVYGKVQLSAPEDLKALARNPDEDELLEMFRETANILTTKHWRSFVHVESYYKLLSGQAKALNIHSVLMPSLVNDFASVLIAGANFEDTGLFALWSKMAVSFKPDEAMAEGLRYRQHGNGNLATIHYALDRNWSRHLLEQETEGKPNLERLRDTAKLVFQGRDFLWQANKSVPDNFFKFGQRLPNNPLGLNEFDKVHDVVFLSALNPSPAHARFLQSRGLTQTEIERQGYCGVAYQAVMRTSLRDATDEHPKNIIVPDERLAQYLADMLPGATLAKLDTGIADQVDRGGRPRVHQDNAEKMRRRREKESKIRAELLAEVFVHRKPQDSLEGGCSPSDSTMPRNETSISSYRGSVSQDQDFWATIYTNIRSSMPEGYLSCASGEHFTKAMAAAHGRKVASKESNPLFSPAIFDPSRSIGSNRGRDNILYLQNIVLDFENGDLRPTDIPELFPDLQLIVTNSYSHTIDGPRFRVIMLTSAKVGPSAYEALWDAVADKLREAGYTKSPRAKSRLKRSGLDHSKRAATSLFYLPAQAASGSDSFFRFYDDDHRHPLNPERWLRNFRLETPSELAVDGANRTGADAAGVAAAIAKWRAASQGQGNEAFYSLALELSRLGFAVEEIEGTLRREANSARSPEERRNQISSIMKSLSKPKRAA